MKIQTPILTLAIASVLGACSNGTGSDGPNSAVKLGQATGIVGGETVNHRITRGSSSVVRIVTVAKIEVDGATTIDKSHCTGVLIASDLVLTAGHCIEGVLGKKVHPMLIDPKTGKAHSEGLPVIVVGRKIDHDSISVRGIAVPPGFSSKNGLTTPDLALLRLASPLPLPARAVRAQIDESVTVRAGQRLLAMGFGVTEVEPAQLEAPSASAKELQKKTFSVVPASKVPWRASRKTPDLFFLATGDSQKKGSLCQGDSGAPVFKSVEERLVLLGITARSERGCEGFAAATKVATYSAWIRRQAAKWRSKLF